MKTLRKGSLGEEVKELQRTLHLLPDGIFGEITEEAVIAHQNKYGLKPDGIVGPLTWETLRPSGSLLLKTKRPVKEIIIHCTATTEGNDVSVESIRAYHIKKKGWSDIGYHFVIYLDGSVHKGRNIDLIGAHCKGHNSGSIGIVYVGGLDKSGKAKDTRTAAQKASLQNLLKEMKALYPKATIHGHHEFANRPCPCFKPKEEYKDL